MVLPASSILTMRQLEIWLGVTDVAPAKLENHLVMQRLAINIFFPIHADGKIPIHADSYNLDLNSFVSAQRHVMSLL